MRALQAARVAFPRMGVQRLQDAFGEPEGFATVSAAYARGRARPHAVDEVLQLRRELVVLLAVQLDHLQVPAKELFFQARARRWVELGGVQAVAADLARRLHER